MMMRRRFALVCALMVPLAVAMPVCATENPVDGDEAAVVDAIRRGEAMYQYDQAVKHMNDAIAEDIPDLTGSGIMGWFVQPAETGQRVVYYAIDNAGPYIVYSAIWDGSTISERTIANQQIPERLTASERRLVTATQIATGYDKGISLCSRARPITITVPRFAENETESVYVLTPQISDGEYVLGGHTRFDIDGGVIISKREFSNQCPVLRKMPNIEAFAVDHILDPVFTEIHVFTALVSGVPILVSTRNGTSGWIIIPIGDKVKVEAIPADKLRTN